MAYPSDFVFLQGWGLSYVFPGARRIGRSAIPQHQNNLQVILDKWYRYAILLDVAGTILPPAVALAIVDSGPVGKDGALRAMPARHVVLLTPSEFSVATQLLSRQHFVRVSPLAATLMDLPASVANKRLAAELSPFDATLTKNRGVGYG